MPRIMIFDDDKTFPEGLKRNFEIRAAEQGLNWDIVLACPQNTDEPPSAFYERGLATLRADYDGGKPFDLILTDLFMPEAVTGYNVLNQAKAIDSTIMTILFTGRIEDFNREQAYASNVYAITKRAGLNNEGVAELFYLSSAALKFREQLRVAAAGCFTDQTVARAKATHSPHLAIAKHTLTIVFWDIRGFSAMTQRLITNPEVMVGFIEEYFNLARRVIGNHHGILDKFIGDGVMAIFGHPLNGRRPADGVPDALDAALEFDREFTILAQKWQHQFKMHGGTKELPRLGCGVHTDVVLAGYVGTGRGEFTAFGQGVNIAARVQDFARDVTILVTNKVVSRAELLPDTRSRYAFDERAKQEEFKNIPGMHDLYSLRKPK